MDRTNWVRLLDLPFLFDGRGLDTRAVVFCCHANDSGGSQRTIVTGLAWENGEDGEMRVSILRRRGFVEIDTGLEADTGILFLGR
jgi:hypothetical protein